MSCTLEMKDILNRLLFEGGLKVTDLARMIKVPQPTLHRIVTGKCINPHKDTLKPIADYFNITVSQLKGLEPLVCDPFLSHQNIISDVSRIPIYSWQDVSSRVESKVVDTIVSGADAPAGAFATQMNDSSMEPQFPRNTILVFSPEEEYVDRNYVMVSLGENHSKVFRQILIDGEHRFLAPLNPSIDIYKMRLLGPKDKIVGRLVEARFKY